MKKHFNITVTGKVQDVYYRDSTKAVADQLGISGFIMNQADGSVYCEAEGDDFMLDSFVDWCQEGPERAVVEAVTHTESEMKNFNNKDFLPKEVIPGAFDDFSQSKYNIDDDKLINTERYIIGINTVFLACLHSLLIFLLYLVCYLISYSFLLHSQVILVSLLS